MKNERKKKKLRTFENFFDMQEMMVEFEGIWADINVEKYLCVTMSILYFFHVIWHFYWNQIWMHDLQLFYYFFFSKCKVTLDAKRKEKVSVGELNKKKNLEFSWFRFLKISLPLPKNFPHTRTWKEIKILIHTTIVREKERKKGILISRWHPRANLSIPIP